MPMENGGKGILILSQSLLRLGCFYLHSRCPDFSGKICSKLCLKKSTLVTISRISLCEFRLFQIYIVRWFLPPGCKFRSWFTCISRNKRCSGPLYSLLCFCDSVLYFLSAVAFSRYYHAGFYFISLNTYT